MSREITEALKYYQETISEEFVRSLERASQVSSRSSVYQSSIVIWLMIYQRLSNDKTLTKAVQELREGASRSLLEERAEGSIRARARRISSRTGGYAKARERVNLEVVEGVAEELTQSMLTPVQKESNVYILDGSSVSVAFSESTIEEYPQYKNHYGKAHYPLVRVGVAVHAQSGVALQPAFAPFNGSKAASELSFVEPLLEQLPKDSTVLADRYYGCFFFIERAKHYEMKTVVRVKNTTFKKLLGGKLPESLHGEQEVLWVPSPYEKKRYPQYENHTGIKGRCIWYTIKKRGKKPTLLYLFTTTSLSIIDAVKLYGVRWDVETDLADIKTTLKMSFITAKSPEVIKKEIILGFVAYNLVRRLMVLAARRLKTTVRELSFRNALRSIEVLGSVLIDNNTSQKIINERIDFHFRTFQQILLPKRKKKQPSTPRTKWRKGNPRYTTNKSLENSYASTLSK